jgi:hypothetical protein
MKLLGFLLTVPENIAQGIGDMFQKQNKDIFLRHSVISGLFLVARKKIPKVVSVT